jgi:hypothetical protein
MPANITSVERKQEQSQEKFHQLVMIIEETIQRIKTALGEDPSTVGQLFSQLESSIQQQNLLISSIQTPKGVTTDSVPTRLPDESSESYTQRVKDQLTQLQAVHSKTIIELDYQRRAHQACHAEVHRLRRLLRSLLKGASAVDGKQLSYERFRQFRNKLAKKLLRYNQIVSSLNQSLREAIVERPLDSGSLRLILDSADSLAKDLAYDKSTILGIANY